MKKIIITVFAFLPFIVQAQKFTFNKDGSSEVVTYKVEKSAREIYNDIVVWVGKYYMMPESVVKESVSNEMIKLEGSYWNPLDIDIDAYKHYIARYTLEIKLKNGQYSVGYIHNKFTKNREEQPLTVQDLNYNNANIKEWKGSKKNYEFKINNTLASLNHYIMTSEFIREPIDIHKIIVPADFKLNEYDSTAVYEFKVDKTADEIYKDVHEWIKKTYVLTPTYLKDSIQIIQFKSGMWKTLNKRLEDENELSPYSSEGLYTFIIEDGKYKVIYKHIEFTINSEPVNLLNLFEKNKTNGKFHQAWANYEYRIYELFDYINHYITRGEFIKKRN